MKKKAKKLKIAITFAPDLLQRVDAAARGLRISRSSYIEKAVLSVLEESEQMATAMGNQAVRDAFFEAFMQPGVLKGITDAMGENVGPNDLKALKGMMQSMSDESDKKSAKKAGKGRK
jgi:hypothetical protein